MSSSRLIRVLMTLCWLKPRPTLTWRPTIFRVCRTFIRDVKSPSATPEATFIQDRDNREEAKATIARAKAARQAAQQNVDYCVIKAPFGGRISRRNVDTNNDVIADATVLASLIQLDPLYAYFDVDDAPCCALGRFCPAARFPPMRPSNFLSR